MRGIQRTKSIIAITIALTFVFSLSVSTLAASIISAEKVKEIAYTDAGITKDQVSSIDELVYFRSGNAIVYKFVFHTASAKYMYNLDAYSGNILERSTSVYNNNTISITPDEAFKIAFSHSGLSMSSLKKHETKLKDKSGFHYYEVELKTENGSKYEYDIDAETGKILNFELKK
jgi:uncharacterized membrane protein YkoI